MKPAELSRIGISLAIIGGLLAIAALLVAPDVAGPIAITGLVIGALFVLAAIAGRLKR